MFSFVFSDNASLIINWKDIEQNTNVLFSVSRQPADPDYLSEHWGTTADPHRLANATQVNVFTRNSAC